MKEPIIYQEDIYLKEKGIKVSVFIDFFDGEFVDVSNIRVLSNNNANIHMKHGNNGIFLRILETIHYDFLNPGEPTLEYRINVKHIRYYDPKEKNSKKVIRVLSEALPSSITTIEQLTGFVISLTTF